MKMLEITGSMAKLSEIETLLLQKTGFPCVAANNAYEMCRAIPTAGFHGHACAPCERCGDEHARRLWRRGRQRGGRKRADPKVKGFIGSSQDLTAPFFGASGGMGTMPHALVGYTGGDVLEGAEAVRRDDTARPSR